MFQARRQQPILTFCASARTGLGHLRRIANIATALERLAPDIGLRLVANAPVDGLSAAERARFVSTHIAARERMARCPALLASSAVVADTAVIPGLELLPRPLALILRETAAPRLPAFRLPGERQWDAALLPAPAGDWTVSAAELGALRVVNIGYVYRTPDGHGGALAREPGTRLLLVATGGGGAAAAALCGELDRIVAAVRRRVPGRLRVVQVAGPRLGPESRLRTADRIVEVGSQLDEAFAAADAVISTAGYNSVLELAATTTPALLCGIGRTYDDQQARAEAWADRIGLAHRAGETDRSAAWLGDVLRSSARRPAAGLGASGCAAAAAILADLARSSLGRSALFKKTYPPARARAATLAATRSQSLFERGLPTPPGLREPSGVAFSRIAGPTAFEDWRDGRAAEHARLIAEIVVPLVRLHRMSRRDLRLRRHDPWRRIAPRLADGSAAAISLGPHRCSIMRRLATAVETQLAACRGLTRRPALVHGDYHLRQLIRPQGAQGYVVVDLDDLAAGAPESDIGNCIAHLVTSPELWPGPIAAGARCLAAQLADAYAAAGGRQLEMNQVQLYVAAGLIRRSLKLAERRRPTSLLERIEAAARELIGEATAPSCDHAAPCPATSDIDVPCTMGRAAASCVS